MAIVNPSEETKELRTDLQEFCKKWFGPEQTMLFDDDAPLSKTGIRFHCMQSHKPSRVYQVFLISNTTAEEVYSNDAAKDFSDLCKKWGHLKDTAEIREGCLEIPYDGLVTLRMEVLVLKEKA